MVTVCAGFAGRGGDEGQEGNSMTFYQMLQKYGQAAARASTVDIVGAEQYAHGVH